MKYVILVVRLGEKSVHDMVYPIIFPETLVHAEVAKHMAHMIGFDSPYGVPEVLSAGFCECCSGGFYVHEHGSESLRVKNDSMRGIKDERILNMPRSLQGLWRRDG